MVILGVGSGVLDSKLGAMANDAGDAFGIPDGDTMQTVLNNTGLEGAMKLAMTTIIGIYNDGAMTLVKSGTSTVGGIVIGAVVWGGEQLTPAKVPAAVKAVQGRHWFNKIQNTVTDFENLLD
jgi:hypothetical protein